MSDRANDQKNPVPNGVKPTLEEENELNQRESRENHEIAARYRYTFARRRLFDARVTYSTDPTDDNLNRLTRARAEFTLAAVFW